MKELQAQVLSLSQVRVGGSLRRGGGMKELQAQVLSLSQVRGGECDEK